MTDDDPTAIDLFALLETVHDEASFVAFLKAFGRDFALEQEFDGHDQPDLCVQGSRGWYNWSVDGVVEAAVACWRGRRHLGDAEPPSNPWRRCAEILYWGKIYE